MKTLGILGGMGPEAGCLFYRTVVRLNPGTRDQDHPPVILYGQTQIPDRGAYLKGNGEDPRPYLVEATRQLQDWGADFIAIPCNTAHFFFAAIQAAVSIPVLNIIDITVQSAAETLNSSALSNRSAGVLATEGTIQSGLYQDALERVGIRALTPSAQGRRKVQGIIQSAKSGRNLTEASQELATIGRGLQKDGAGALIFGCTELGLLTARFDCPVIDSVTALAEASIEIALGARALPRTQPAA